MARNLKKFVNPKFVRTVNLVLLRRLLERHRGQTPSFDFAVFDGDPAVARDAVGAWFMGPETECPEGLVVDIHHLAEVGCENGLDLLVAEARRNGVDLISRLAEPAMQDPKHVALVAYLDHRAIFDVVADRLAFLRCSTVAELLSRDPNLMPRLDEAALERTSSSAPHVRCFRQCIMIRGIRQAAAAIFEADLHGDLCRVTTYRDGDEVVLIVTHSKPIVTAPVIENGRETTSCWRPLHQGRMAYVASEGRLKIGGVSKLRRARLAEAFGRAVLEREGQFSGSNAFNLYTLEPIERNWPEVRLSHQFDPAIERVLVVQAQVDRVVRDMLGKPGKPLWSIVVTDETDGALTRLREVRSDVDFRGGWRLGMVRIRVEFRCSRGRSPSVLVEIRPSSVASFRRTRFEGAILDFLERNGLRHVRDITDTALAAE